MKSSLVKLSSFSPVPTILIREMNGFDEMLVTDCSTITALRFINNVISIPGKDPETIHSEKLPVTDRDLILSKIYSNTYGTRIESSLNCNACQKPYDINFSLDDFVADRRKTIVHEEVVREESGYFKVRDHFRFRLPTGEDELAVIGMPAEKAHNVLLERCIPGLGSESAEVREVMEDVGPTLANHIPIQCPECNSEQTVYFDIQTYLLTNIRNDRAKLLLDVHRIAMAYGWAQHEILSLYKSERQSFSTMIMVSA